MLLSAGSSVRAAVTISSPTIVATDAAMQQGVADNTLVDGQFVMFPGGRYWLASVFDLDGGIDQVLSKSVPGQMIPYSDGIAWRKESCYLDPVDSTCRDAPAGEEWRYAFTSFAPGLVETGISLLWFMDVYSPGGQNANEMLAFVHEEREGDPDLTAGNGHEGFTRIGLAWSSDSGNSWRYLGKIVRARFDRTPHNIKGAPYIVRTDPSDGRDYFYFYYEDNDGTPDPNPNDDVPHYTAGIGVSRASVDDVISAARNFGNSGTGLWKKYNDGAWSTDAYDSPDGRPFPTGMHTYPQAGLWGMTHTQTIESGGYYWMPLTMMSWTGSTWVKLFRSRDGLQWTQVATLVEESKYSQGKKPGGYQYCSVAGTDGAANHIAGSDFYVYCLKLSQGNIGDVIEYRALYRWKVDIAADPADFFRQSKDYSSGPQQPGPWRYRWGDGTNVLDMTPESGGYWRGGDPWARIYPTGVHPGLNGDIPVVQWTAPRSGVVDIDGTVRDQDPGDINGACAGTYMDGVDAKLVKITPSQGGTQGSTLLSMHVDNRDTVGKPAAISTYVTAGTDLYFMVDGIADSDCDSTAWDPSVTYR